jgi:hypothetical protein
MSKRISEKKCTCKSCGKIWFYGKNELKHNSEAKSDEVVKVAMCCSGCAPALLVPTKKPIDLNKCPNCGSRAITVQEVIHEV